MRVRRATVDDLEFIRETRNAGRFNMTRDTSLIHPYDSEVWWASKPNAWVLEVEGFSLTSAGGHYAFPVGYAVLREIDNEFWISLAVDPHHQGKGYGTHIYRHFHPLVKAEIFKSNLASIKAAEKAGMKVVSESDDKVVMGP